jgi:hypothetical protein
VTREELDRVLELHRQWLAGGGGNPYDPKSGRAKLAGAHLAIADLRGVNLRDASLKHANLAGADLRYANVRAADFLGANLRQANLQCANLRGANLRYARVRQANLYYANLHGADLRVADLYDAKLRGVRTNWFTRMTARTALNLTEEQRAQLGMQPPPRAENARRARATTDLARRLRR